MILPTTAQVQLARYAPSTEDSTGMPVDAWETPVPIDVCGWWQSTADEIGIDSGRRSQEIVRSLLIPRDTACGDKDHWTIPGDDAFEQVGEAQDFNHGPFGMSVPLIVSLKSVEG
jgi:hypothetical protein